MVANFADAYALLDEAGGALTVARPEDLGKTLIGLFAIAEMIKPYPRRATDPSPGDAVDAEHHGLAVDDAKYRSISSRLTFNARM